MKNNALQTYTRVSARHLICSFIQETCNFEHDNIGYNGLAAMENVSNKCQYCSFEDAKF